MRRKPDDWAALNNLAACLRQRGQIETAIALWKRAVAANPDDLGLRMGLARGYLYSRRWEAARRALATATPEEEQTRADLWHLRGNIAFFDGRYSQAIDYYGRSLAIKPEQGDSTWDRCLAYLASGDYRKGWEHHDERCRILRQDLDKTPVPTWKGEPLKGKTLWVYSEQAMGDALAYSRFLPRLFDLSPLLSGVVKVVLHLNHELMRLFKAQPAFSRVDIQPLDSPVPEADYSLPLGSLMSRLNITLDDIDGSPYLTAPDEPLSGLHPDGPPRIGIVWHSGENTGQGHWRDIPFGEMLELVGACPDFDFYSLQVGRWAADVRGFGASAVVTDLSPYILDWATTAAYLRRMDHLVTCDTSIAHCAGALGVPTTVLVPHDGAWLWQAERNLRSSWYKSVRIVRQAPPNYFGRSSWLPELVKISDYLAQRIN